MPGVLPKRIMEQADQKCQEFMTSDLAWVFCSTPGWGQLLVSLSEMTLTNCVPSAESSPSLTPLHGQLQSPSCRHLSVRERAPSENFLPLVSILGWLVIDNPLHPATATLQRAVCTGGAHLSVRHQLFIMSPVMSRPFTLLESLFVRSLT